jgi:hypothetical protein
MLAVGNPAFVTPETPRAGVPLLLLSSTTAYPLKKKYKDVKLYPLLLACVDIAVNL